MTNGFAFHHFSYLQTQFLSIKNSFYAKLTAELILILIALRTHGCELVPGVRQPSAVGEQNPAAS